MKLHIDLETRSRVDLKKVGIDVYSHHDTTEVILFAYAFDDEPVELWEPHTGPMPERLRAALTDKSCLKFSWNVGFEFNVIRHRLGIDLQIDQWRDPAAHSRYLGFPDGLDLAGQVLGVSLDHQKLKSGKSLLKLFTSPTRATKKKPSIFNDWTSHPAEWIEFMKYCKQDVIAEREIHHNLCKRNAWPEKEQQVWILDQVINLRGIPIDLDFAARALDLVQKERATILDDIAKITGVENPNSPPQMKAWFETQGMNFESLDKENVATALKNNAISENVRAVLELKQTLGGIAFKKLPVIQQWTYEDRLRNAFLYHSAHTGRWSSKGVQFHNLLKPTKRVAENLEAVYKAIKFGEPWPKDIPVIEGVSGCLRAAVHALEGARLFAADYSSIENRVLAWLAQCPGMMEVFEKGLDPYKAFAALMYKIPYDQVTKEQRNFCKSPVLGCGFGMGANRLVFYAAGMGQIITEVEAKKLVDAWREAYPEVPEYWEAVGDTAVQAVLRKQHLQLGPLRFDGRDPDMLKITLPSGRQLCYDKPEIGRDRFMKAIVTHMAEVKNQWMRIEARGSSLVENVVQAVARDLLVAGMQNATAAGFNVVLHVHDELVAEVKYDSPLTYKLFEKAMTTNPIWGLDIPLKVEGDECPYYKK